MPKANRSTQLLDLLHSNNWHVLKTYPTPPIEEVLERSFFMQEPADIVCMKAFDDAIKQEEFLAQPNRDTSIPYRNMLGTDSWFDEEGTLVGEAFPT